MFTPDATGLKFGPLWFAPGFTAGNARGALFAAFTVVGLNAFMNFVQPYLLTEILHLPASEQGRLTGLLASLQEVVALALAGFIGAWSDRSGRRPVMVTGFLVMALGYFIYPLASSTAELVAFRLVFAMGAIATGVMLSACVVDTIQEVSRAKWVGVISIFNGIGVVFMSLVLARLPDRYMGLGIEPAAAGRYALWTAAALAMLSALVLRYWLRGGLTATPRHRRLTRQLAAGIRAGLGNPRLALAYGAAFIGRGDLVVVGTFFSLWITQAGADKGMPTGQALGRAGMMFGILQMAAVGWAFFMGMISDRLNRVTGLGIALGLAAAGYGLMGEVKDPFAPGLLPIAVLLGIGETSVIVAGGALLGQETTPPIRGALVGLYGFMGAIGILFASFVGGLIFDEFGRTAPFTMMGILNGVLLVMAVLVRLRAGEPGSLPSRATDTA